MFEKFVSSSELGTKPNKGSKSKGNYAPNTKIAYKPNLIPSLVNENKVLIELFDKAQRSAKTRLGWRLRKQLNQFKDHFVDHLLRQNISVYIYLQHVSSGNTRKTIRLVKGEMDQIGREIMAFVDYAISGPSLDEKFLSKMDRARELLLRRIDQEEDFIYPSYQATGNGAARANHLI